MIEIFDREDASFLKKYEKYFLEVNHKVQETGPSYIVNMPQYRIENKDFIADLMSNYTDVYPGWIPFTNYSYVFRFQPDTLTMLPHIDLDVETCKALKGIAKRVLIYANPVWDTKWNGGTYFAPFEQYKVSKRHVAIVRKEKFAEEATLVENVPGRIVVFDPDEIHMPQEFSGNNVQRLIFGGMIFHPDYIHLSEDMAGPTNENGNAVTKLLSLPKT